MEANIDQIIRETQASIKQKVSHAEELLDAARREQQLIDALSVAKHQLEEKEAEKNHWMNRCTQAEKALDIERTRPMNSFNGCQINGLIENQWNYDNTQQLPNSGADPESKQLLL